ncbi:MAG TPA: sugar transferase [Bryobacteraceae bacterium]|nr:sugar transferase [Bryobacteraceae bacterium]
MIRLFRVLVPTSVAALLLSEIALVLACYTAASLVTPGIAPRVYLVDEANHWKILLVSAVIILGFYFQDLYAEFRILSRILLIQEVCLAVGAALLLMAVLGYINTDYLLPRGPMVAGSFAVVLSVPVWRIVYWKYVIRALRHERVLLLGESRFLAETARHILMRPQLGYQIIGYLSEAGVEDFPVRYLGPVSALARIFEEYRPTRIIVGMAEGTNHLPAVEELLEIHFAGVVIEDAADTYEMAAQRVCTSKIQVSQLVFTSEFGPSQKALATQSIYSVLFGLCGLLCTLPIMVLVALAIKASSRGPVFYRQRRVGMNGRIFTLYKFRSMYVNAEAATGAVWARKNDPRVTPVGRILRKLRFDELPQFWNVVKGDMSIVGPRPERPEFVEMLADRVPCYRQRHAVKPGITGWAQINHKYGDTDRDALVKLEYDLYYIKHIAPALDFFIIFHTLKVMLLQRGAQ